MTWHLGRMAVESGTFSSAVDTSVKLVIYCAEERIRDADNWLARFKPGMDGLVDAGVLKADDVNHLAVTEVVFVVDAGAAPKTIIEIKAGC